MKKKHPKPLTRKQIRDKASPLCHEMLSNLSDLGGRRPTFTELFQFREDVYLAGYLAGRAAGRKEGAAPQDTITLSQLDIEAMRRWPMHRSYDSSRLFDCLIFLSGMSRREACEHLDKREAMRKEGKK